ncbi:ABC transporter substrate-binding protein [Microvirga alba]|uniref:ABC transporter substrate-binding protein n=1 Tax=Microvirga alba TaxID=2791025 RepID=A0A931BR08_9HYPH|nr:ABC transporter substrate-binding protein [Microvirga alba]MBF9235331.1 ABC transporter substrate-binding protein [Microvirga alba]
MSRSSLWLACAVAWPITLAMPQAANAGPKDMVVVHYRLPASAYAMETADTYVLMRAGCLETLTKYAKDGRLAPSLAESWTQIDDNSWDFKIRPNVKFQDGTSLNAEAVAASLNHVLKATTPPRGFTPAEISSITIVDSMTLRISTPTAVQLLPYRLAGPSTGILSQAAYRPDGINIIGTCTGPFTIAKENPKQSLQLVRNDNYWGNKAKLTSIDFRFISDGGTRVAQLRSGEAHLVMGIPAANAQTLKSNKNLRVVTTTLPRTTKLVVNNSREPYKDVRVRQALQYAINRDEIAMGVFEGFATPAIGPFGPGQPWSYGDERAIPYDPEKAKTLLKEAGVDPAKLKLELMAYTDRAELPVLATVIQAQLKKIGVNADVKVANWPAIEPNFRAGTFDTGLLSRSAVTDMSDPSGYLIADYSCDGSYNLGKVCDPKIDKDIKDAMAIKDDAERNKRYRAIAEELQAKAVAVYLVHEQQIDGMSQRVRNFDLDQLGYYLVTEELDLE